MTLNYHHDDDLQDLMGKQQQQQRDGRSEMKPLNLDHLSQGELDVPVKRRHSGGGTSNSCLRLCCAYLAYLCDYAPRFCCCLGIVALLLLTYVLVVTVFFNPTEHFGVDTDYSGIASTYDLTLGKIDHWCLKGDNESCRCEDPLEPQSRGEFRGWARAHVANTESIDSLIASGNGSPDIAFLGGSIVEAMDGKWFGKNNPDDDNLDALKKMFKRNFDKAGLHAVSLGIAGDSNPTVLWRLLNGEMPTAFKPKIWWLELGLNDLGRSQCSEEVVVLGILRVVEEILEKKTDAIVVINSLFPMADLRGGLKTGENDFKDAFDPNLRTTSTAKIQKIETREFKKKNKGAKIDTIQADAGDSTHSSHLKDDAVKKRDKNKKGEKNAKKDKDKKEEKDAKKDKDKKEEKDAKKDKKETSGKRILLEETQLVPDERHLALRNRNKAKEIKMQDNKEKQKKFKGIAHRERKLPLWTSITAVNKQLRKFADKNDKVYFFDSTDIFTEREDRNTFLLKTEMISIRGHPSLKGFEAWEKAIIDRAKSILSPKPTTDGGV